MHHASVHGSWRENASFAMLGVTAMELFASLFLADVPRVNDIANRDYRIA
jgi:hypothetical protein